MICLATLIISGCGNQESTESDALTTSSAFQIFADSLAMLESPFYVTEVDLQYLKHSKYLALDSSSLQLLISNRDQEAQYFLVGRMSIDSTFITIIILESKVDSMFNASERFLVNNYDVNGNILGSTEMSASITGNDHFIITGIINEDGLISTEKYQFLFENGEWEKVPEPIVIVQYMIDSSGAIKQSSVFMNMKNGSDSSASAI